jgi:hypothetical protein
MVFKGNEPQRIGVEMKTRKHTFTQTVNRKADAIEIIRRKNQEKEMEVGHGPVRIFTSEGSFAEAMAEPAYKGCEITRHTQRDLREITAGGSSDYYERREAYALEHLECFDCEVPVQKIRAGDFMCPSCGDTFRG